MLPTSVHTGFLASFPGHSPTKSLGTRLEDPWPIFQDPPWVSPQTHKICFVFVSCVHRRVVEGMGWVVHGCTVHVDVHGE